MRKIVRSIAVAGTTVALVAGWSAPAGAQERAARRPRLSHGPDVRHPASHAAVGARLPARHRPAAAGHERADRQLRAGGRRASDRVISFDIGRTWAGRPLRAAIVSSREHMRPAELRRIRERFVALREGRGGRHDGLRGSPAIVWLAGNVTAARRAAPTPS